MNTNSESKKDLPFAILFCYIGYLTCYFFYKIGLHPIMASSLTGVLVSLIPDAYFYKSSDAKACVYTASFAAIGSHLNYNSLSEFLLIPFYLGTFFFFLRSSFVGFGGKLGTMAFLSTTLYLFLKEIF